MTPKLPMRFILVWLVNLAVILALDICLGLRPGFRRFSDVAYLYLAIGAAAAYLELALWDKLKGK